jgi:hypothetical protein
MSEPTKHPEATGTKLPTRLICKRYNVCDRTIARWQANPALNFPQPTVINGRKYFDEDQMTAWDRSRAAAA